MNRADGMRSHFRNHLKTRDLSFREFMDVALYDAENGYYSTAENPVGRAGDYVTSPVLSPVFAFALARLIRDFATGGGDVVSTIVDVGCGDGRLIDALYRETEEELRTRLRFFGVDRMLGRLAPEARQNAALTFVNSVDAVPNDSPTLVLSNELFDAFPFARLVQRADGLHELTVIERDGELDWGERPAPQEYVEYFAARRISLEEGQFADISLDWERVYGAMCDRFPTALVVTFDYAYPERLLFHPRARRFGTAAAYSHHRVTRDLLKDPGEQDLTAHINFDDLVRTGEAKGFTTLFSGRQAGFLLGLGGAEHPLFRPLEESGVRSLQEGVDLLQVREDARRLLLPDGIGEEIRVLVQQRGLGAYHWGFLGTM